ncbi:MAG: SDR family NAD(P)-dependent oxidoreductase [Treponema sp.]|jgi:NAD(P)-dependent dehydrogenase (short-subunit alcohol dehydrogenase family)|nr:SDR family NAD(P)-dependent oxidoreductase [Treponema sp.]
MNNSKKAIAITGASRGLGLVMTREFLAAGDTVYALVRGGGGKELSALLPRFPDTLVTVPCDVGSTESVGRAAEEVKARTNHLDMLVNNAGVNFDMGHVVDFTQTDFDEMEKTFNINTVGVMRVVKAFDPLLREGSWSVAISSGAGSITRNPATEVEIAYRVSKTALNMAFRLYGNTVRKRKVRTLLVDPGWMRTAMGGPGATCDPEENGRLIVSLLKSADTLSEDVLFVDFNGKEVPW